MLRSFHFSADGTGSRTGGRGPGRRLLPQITGRRSSSDSADPSGRSLSRYWQVRSTVSKVGCFESNQIHLNSTLWLQCQGNHLQRPVRPEKSVEVFPARGNVQSGTGEGTFHRNRSGSVLAADRILRIRRETGTLSNARHLPNSRPGHRPPTRFATGCFDQQNFFRCSKTSRFTSSGQSSGRSGAP